jgi:hypothetical protein
VEAIYMKMNRKFKVGDEVKIIANTGDHQFPIGTIGTISMKCSDHYEVRAKGEFWYLDDGELQATKTQKRWYEFWK